MKMIAPSILSADGGRLSQEIQAVEKAGADWIHVDVMDGQFVPNITMGPAIISAVRKATKLPFDVHLMIKNPEYKLPWIGIQKEDIVTIHYESTFQVQRATILDAAAGLFAARGFHHASMAEIARECGVSKALLYHYYRDKEHILYDIAAGHVEELLAIVAEVEAAAAAPRERLERLILRFMQAYEGGRRQHVVLIQDVKFLSPEQRARIHEQERRVVRAFALTIEAVEPGLRGVALDKAVAMVLFGMMNWTFTWLRPEGTLSYEALARVVARVFVRGIAGLATEAVQAPAGGSEAALPRGVCERS